MCEMLSGVGLCGVVWDVVRRGVVWGCVGCLRGEFMGLQDGLGPAVSASSAMVDGDQQQRDVFSTRKRQGSKAAG